MGEWVKACAIDEVDEEDVVPFIHNGHDYAIFRGEGEHFYASDGHCTHEKQLLCDGLVMGNVIECPKHNGRFDIRNGAALGAPVLVGLKIYPVELIDGHVYIDING